MSGALARPEGDAAAPRSNLHYRLETGEVRTLGAGLPGAAGMAGYDRRPAGPTGPTGPRAAGPLGAPARSVTKRESNGEISGP